jgi:hypothetical protein
VSLLWSFRNPVHERRLRELVTEQDPELFVALSCEVSSRIREFSRNATTIMSTQIGPGLRDYLTALTGSANGLPASIHVSYLEEPISTTTPDQLRNQRKRCSRADQLLGSAVGGHPADRAARRSAANVAVHAAQSTPSRRRWGRPFSTLS